MKIDKDYRTFVSIFIVIIIIAAVFEVGLTAGAWSYDDHHGDGPSHWKKSYPDCGKNRQSPIDIIPSESEFKDITTLQFEGYDHVPTRNSYKLINNGHTVQLNVDKGDMTISSADLLGRYKLAQFHLHWGSTNDHGSEHTLDGRSFPMEIHFVHFNERYGNLEEALKHSDGLAVVGVFFEVEHKSHPALDRLIEQFCLIKYAGTNSSDVSVFRMDSLLPKDRSAFYRYNGSLTTPGCKEIVTWTVLTDTVKISQSQLNAFRALGHHSKGGNNDDPLVDNFRPVQPLGSRLLLRNHEVLLLNSKATALTSPITVSIFLGIAAIFTIAIGIIR